MHDAHEEQKIPPRAPALIRAFGSALAGLVTLVEGMIVTWRNFLLPQVTVHYPRQVISSDALVTYRGHVILSADPNAPDQPQCRACGLCTKVCPSNCFTLVLGKGPAGPDGKEKKVAVVFELDFTRCSLCGLCVQGCPASGLRFSNDIYSVGFSRGDFRYDLLAPFRRQESQDTTSETESGSGEA